jgi:hypothetical protein
MQALAHADWQQTPSTHSPERHCRFPVQRKPSAAFLMFGFPEASGSNTEGDRLTECGGAQAVAVVNTNISSAMKHLSRTLDPSKRAALSGHYAIAHFERGGFLVEIGRRTPTRITESQTRGLCGQLRDRITAVPVRPHALPSAVT